MKGMKLHPSCRPETANALEQNVTVQEYEAENTNFDMQWIELNVQRV